MIALILYFFSLLILKVFSNIFTDSNYLIIIVFFINFILLLIYLIKNIKNRKILLLFLISLFLSTFLLIYDVYIDYLPNSGTDSEGFYNAAIKLVNNYSFSESLFVDCYGELWTKILSIIIRLDGGSRVFTQFFCVLLGLLSNVIVYKCLLNIKCNNKTTLTCISICTLLPNNLFLFSTLRRESVIFFCVCVSLFFFIKWVNANNIIFYLLSITMIIIGSIFHSGIIFIILGYLYLYFKSLKLHIFKDSIKKKALFLLFLVVMCIVLYYNRDVFLGKFSNLSSSEDLYTVFNRNYGGSAYLSNLEVNSIKTFIIYSLPKIFYFFFSPMPWNCRGIVDIFTFVLDGLIYLYLFLSIINNFKKNKKNDSFASALIISIIVTGLVFSIGTFTAGTAIRHRFKIIPLIVILYGYSNTKKRKVKYEENICNNTNL